MNEYAYIQPDGQGGERIYRLGTLDPAKWATLKPKKRADIRPVDRVDDTINPATHKLGPESITILPAKVKIVRRAVALTADERAARIDRMRKTAYVAAGLTDTAIATAVFNSDLDNGAELARLRGVRDTINTEHPLP